MILIPILAFVFSMAQTLISMKTMDTSAAGGNSGCMKATFFIMPIFSIVLVRSLLTEYLEERGIPYAIASRHCCRLNYGVRGKRYFAVGFPNMAGGYEVRSRYFKGCIPPKSVSLVKANDIPADECLVFEGFMDFLSAVTLGVTGNADCLVLNSVANVEKAAGLLDGYGRIGCFLDRDEAGRRTLAALTMRYGERVTDRSSLYDGCKDLNEYLQLTTKKQKNNHLKIEEQ